MIMLNTSIHNPKVDRKMTLEDFVRNFRNADEDAAISDKILEAMYRSIKEVLSLFQIRHPVHQIILSSNIRKNSKLEGMSRTNPEESSNHLHLDPSNPNPNPNLNPNPNPNPNPSLHSISVKNLPTRLCLGETSGPITVSIPLADPSLRVKLQGRGLECEPSVLSFENPKQSFTITPLSLGFGTLAFAKMGKSARLYSKPHPVNIPIRFPAFEYNLAFSIAAGPSKKAQEQITLGFRSHEEKKKWASLFESTQESLRKERSKLRSDSVTTPVLNLD